MFQDLLTKLARTFDDARIPYMVIGGQAVLIHGEPRLTRDIDVTLGVDAGELARVRSATQRIGLFPSVEHVEDFVRKTNVLPLKTESTFIRIDLIFSFTPYEAGAIARGVGIRFGDTTVRFASVEDLIIHKLVAGRPRDLEDVRGILARDPTLDEPYVRQWLSSFSEVVHNDLVSEYGRLKREQETDRGSPK